MHYPLQLQDADFERRLLWCRSPLEGRSKRWVPFGMPRLNSRFKNMVFFLYGRHPKTGKIRGPLGTGFLVGMQGRGDWYLHHYYAVTCHHVAVQHGASIIRINTKDGKHRFIELEPHEWEFVPNADDLCAADVTERFQREDDISLLPENLMMRRDFISQESVEIGEDGFMLGLFAEHPGTDQNLIAARFGNLSLLANDTEQIEQPNKRKRPSHLFDMRSRPGFSGSPVFLYRTPAGDLRSATERGQDKVIRQTASRRHSRQPSNVELLVDDFDLRDNTFLVLLGVHAGQYPEHVKVQKIKQVAAENDDIIRDGTKIKIPSSMTVVVPAWEIVNLLNCQTFVELREKRDQESMRKRDSKNVAEPEVIEPAVDIESSASASDAESSNTNPTHREDFTRLVGAAARKPAPKD